MREDNDEDTSAQWFMRAFDESLVDAKCKEMKGNEYCLVLNLFGVVVPFLSIEHLWSKQNKAKSLGRSFTNEKKVVKLYIIWFREKYMGYKSRY